MSDVTSLSSMLQSDQKSIVHFDNLDGYMLFFFFVAFVFPP